MQRGGIEPICFRLAGYNRGIIGARARIFNGIEQIDVLDHPRDFFFRVSQMFQGGPDCLVDDFQHTAAGEELVFYQRDIGLDSGRVAVH